MVPAARFGRRDLLVWVVPGSRDNFFRHAQGHQEPRGTELIAGAQPVRRTDSQAEWGRRCERMDALRANLNYLVSGLWVERTLDNPAVASISCKAFSWVRFRAFLWVRLLRGRVVGYSEVET